MTLTSEWSLGSISQGSLTERALGTSSFAFLHLLLCELVYPSFSWLVNIGLCFRRTVADP